MKGKLLYVAAFLVLLSMSFSFNESEVNWMWEDQPQVPLLLVVTSIILIGMSFYLRRRQGNR